MKGKNNYFVHCSCGLFGFFAVILLPFRKNHEFWHVDKKFLLKFLV